MVQKKKIQSQTIHDSIIGTITVKEFFMNQIEHKIDKQFNNDKSAQNYFNISQLSTVVFNKIIELLDNIKLKLSLGRYLFI